jgi:hypothetical protein
VCRVSLLAPSISPLRAEARSDDREGLPLRRCRDGVSYFEVCGWLVSDEVAALGGFACSPREYSATRASWYLHGVSKPPHIPFGRGGGGSR